MKALKDVHSLQDAPKENDSQSTTSINTVNNETPKYTIKDSVFRHLFLDPRYGLKLFHVLHPEDTEATEADISYLTIIREITNGIRNDLGMYINGRYLILIEAQTTWSVNILVRMFIYLAEIWKNHIVQNGLDVFSSKAIELPMPEFYVVYTGSRKTRPDCLKLSRDLFHGKCADIELTVHMLYNGENKGDILDQYVSFTDQVDHFYKTYGRTQEAVRRLIDYCIEHNILKDYLTSRAEEVTSMLEVIFDDTLHRKKMLEEAEARGESRGKVQGERCGIIKGKRDTVLRLHRMHYDTDTIAEIVDVPVRQVEEWLSAELVL